MTANLLSTLKMSLELTDVLCDIERAGIKVNVDTLNTLREDFEKPNVFMAVPTIYAKLIQKHDDLELRKKYNVKGKQCY